MSRFILRYKLFVAIVASNQRVTAALKKAGLASSFLDMTKEEEDMNPHIELLNDASHLSEETSTFATQSWWKPENRVSGRFD